MDRYDKEQFRLPTWIYLVLIFLILFFGSRYGWRVFGFSQCSAGMAVGEVKVEDTGVSLKVINPSSFPMGGFVGSTALQEGKTLYVGVKYNMVLGWFPTDSQTMDCYFETDGPVEKVVLRSAGNDVVLYDESVDDRITIKLQIENILLDELGYTCYLGENPVVQGAIAVENQNSFVIPFEFHKEQFPKDADIQSLGLLFELKGAEDSIAVEGPIRPQIDWGEEAVIKIVSIEDVVSVTVNH